jgi:hypothetical protein
MRTILLLCLAVVLAAGQAPAPAGIQPPFIVPKPAPVVIAKPDWTIKLKDGQPDIARLREAFSSGGTIVFDTGGQPVTLKLDEQLLMSQRAQPIVLDGMGLVTIDGQEKTRAIAKEWKTDLTVQRLRFVNCRAKDTGAAIWNTNFDGKLSVIDCQFENCKTTEKGPDDGGGAIGVRGQKPMLISNCSFVDCDASNGGAINTIQCEVYLIDCSFEQCDAFGLGGGADQGPVGQGGIGGAVYCDTVNNPREGWEYFIAGCLFRNNTAGDHAGGMFAYNNDKQGGHIFWNCHFENNTVGKDARVKHAGAIYTQHSRHLWVGNCSFWDNATPGGGGAIFTALNVKEEFINSQFAGNSPEFSKEGSGLTFKKSSPPPSVAALGRVPGPVGAWFSAEPAKKGKAKPSKPESKPAAPAVAAKPRVQPTPEARTAFTAQLQTRAIAAASTGKGPVFLLASMKAQATMEAADAQGMELRVGGTVLSVAWKTLSDADRAEMAIYLARSGMMADWALAAFWLKVAGRDAESATALSKSGADGAAVEAAFKE